MNKGRVKGIIYLLITAIIWGGSFISQLVGGNILGTFTFCFYRCFIGCITIAIMILISNKKKFNKITFFTDGEDIEYTVKNSMWCGIVLFFAMITQQKGVEITDTAKSGLITSLEVIFVPIIMLIVYKKKIKFLTWVFIFTSMIGIMMLSVNSISGINVGDVLVFISAILYSVTILQVPKYIKNIEPLKFSFFRFFMITILCFIFSFIFREKLFSLKGIKLGITSILYSGIMSSGVAYTFSILGQKECEPVIATLIMSLEGVFAAIFGWIILGQYLNFVQIIGIIIAFLSIIVVQISDIYF